MSSFRSVRERKTLYIALAAAILASFFSSFALIMTTEPGVYLEIVPYRVADNRSVVDESELFRKSKDVVLCIRAEANFPSDEDLPLIASGCYSGLPIIHIPYERLERVANSWVALLRERRVSPEDINEHVFGMITRVSILNGSSGEVLYHAVNSIPLTIGDLVKRHMVWYTLRMVRGSSHIWHEKKIVNFAVKNNVVVAGVEEEAYTEGGSSGSTDVLPNQFRWEYRLVARITTEDLRQYLPSDYFTYSNNKLYVKVPVLIVYNQYYYSGVIDSSINIGVGARTEVRLTFAAGEIISKLHNAEFPSVNFELKDASWGGYYYFYKSLYVPPGEAQWVYVWGRPRYELWEVWVCRDVCVYAKDEAIAVVEDLLVSGSTILGGKSSGLPHPAIMDLFFGGTNETLLQIPGTLASDGDLDAGEFIAFEQIFKYYDTCGSDFEVGIPVGSLVALAICSALGIPTGGTACAVAMAFGAAFQLSLGVEGSAMVTGGLENLGEHLGRGYNVSEVVYIKLSKYNYQVPPPWWCFWCSPCVYRVPAGIYFRCA
ncbi:MAG: hypothetical protein ABWK00_03835 [Desulfurococcaceae archaeon]